MKIIEFNRIGGTFYVMLYDKSSSTVYSPYIQFSLNGGIQWKPICKHIVDNKSWICGWLFVFIGYLKSISDDLGGN